jgi:hypothetical protein
MIDLSDVLPSLESVEISSHNVHAGFGDTSSVHDSTSMRSGSSGSSGSDLVAESPGGVVHGSMSSLLHSSSVGVDSTDSVVVFAHHSVVSIGHSLEVVKSSAVSSLVSSIDGTDVSV